MQVLEASGSIRSEKIGRVRTCTIVPTALRTAERVDRRPANQLGENGSTASAHYLAENPDEPKKGDP